MARHDPNVQTGIDMRNARTKKTVNVEDLTIFLHHGHEEWNAKKKIIDILQREPLLDKSRREFMTRTERYEDGMNITNRIYELQQLHGWTENETKVALSSVDQPLPIHLHNIAFQPVFNLQAGPVLLKKYGPLITSRAMIGCYLQTELGHGTNVSRLETTATFLPDTQEFEVNSPTLTSSKWWIGALGKTATHGVVQAKLILDGGKDVGPHLFLVQLRSLEDHRVQPGIVIGDIGPKVMGGFPATDNGFARFSCVRIPKENMLSGFAQITENGQYVQPPHAKISYGGMLYIRSTMVTSAGWVIAKAATISIRYATVRRQGEIGKDGLEKQIITYPSVYYRLLPILARAYTFIQLGRSLTNAFSSMADRLMKGDTSLLAELHATTTGLKILVSTAGAQDIEVARRALGGHGFSAFSGLGNVYANYLPATTYEGDNFVLDQQVVRAALKTYRRLFSSGGQPSVDLFSPSSSFLRYMIDPALTPTHSVIHEAQWRDPETSILLLERRAAVMVHDHVQNLDSGEGAFTEDANANQRLSKAVTEAFVGVQVGNIIKTLGGTLQESDATMVRKILLLYLLTTVDAALIDLLSLSLLPPLSARSGLGAGMGIKNATPFNSGSKASRSRSTNLSSSGGDPVKSLRLTIDALCRELAPEAVGLTDAFGFTDWELDSALGVADGKVYEALWERAQKDPLNQKEVPDAYEKSIKPILQRGLRILQDKDKAKL
ncbi:peroxisomal oxidase [Crepidotus variabilis]|uniref:Acyl-coenzyme A oxidase n=1 Tax=Crepidotus variabilis TaxID=179855 RepID=A0A9P6EHM9_9AGAR|nr:peroxisomal oxidase [Crepidotus variabilis]